MKEENRLILMVESRLSGLLSEILHEDVGVISDVPGNIDKAKDLMQGRTYGAMVIEPMAYATPHQGEELCDFLQKARETGTTVFFHSSQTSGVLSHLFKLRQGEHYDNIIDSRDSLNNLVLALKEWYAR